jgi:hypothetical protein
LTDLTNTAAEVINGSRTKRCTPTACAPFVPHSLSAAGELGRCAAARGLAACHTLNMDETEFKRRLEVATEEAITFAKRFVSDDMPPQYRYVVFVFRCPDVEYRQGEFEDFTFCSQPIRLQGCFLKAIVFRDE